MGTLFLKTSDHDKPVTETLEQRNKRYGGFSNIAKTSQDLKKVIRNVKKYDELSPDKRESIDHILEKVARIIHGDPEYKDNWHDIQGYAKLAEDNCKP